MVVRNRPLLRPRLTVVNEWLELNRSNWDSRVPVHVASSFYDLDGFRSGRDTIGPLQAAEVGDVTGKRLVHLQCHIGLDTLSWARRGAVVSGLDFSSSAIAVARSLAGELGIDAVFVESDVYDATAAFGGARFDVVYTGIGALCWLPSVTRWASVVASLLEPGGFLYLLDGHPFVEVLDESFTVAVDYFDSSGLVEDYPYTYTDGPEIAQPRSVQFQHPFGTVLTALAEAGLRIEFVHEFDFDMFQRFEALEAEPDGSYRLPAGRPRVPMMFSVRASLGRLGRSGRWRRYATSWWCLPGTPCGCSSMVELQPSKLAMRVRFPSPALFVSATGHWWPSSTGLVRLPSHRSPHRR
jgi:SAM-dependent methyltransferase